ncbi:potassium channel family protein [Zoogloea sp. 1C4]|uniref:potassium channel family protein n=1 Tax=Zoogloea sp. 1C4 TaxID=2570190 RepID=UPI0012922BDD|nr:potassium channel family protein [Zoogloea sp. 1C4]
MLVVALICLVLLVLTTVLHYEVLRWLSAGLPALGIRPRAKLVVVIIAAFLAHVAEIGLYALAIVVLVRVGGLGMLGDPARFGFDVALYFSAETFTSLGYGDVVPSGDMRLLAGAEALNGLLLIGWSASYAYIAMERFWNGASRSSD